MELSINALVERAEDFLFEWNSARYRKAAGLSAAFSAQALFADFPELTRLETAQRISELAASPRADDTRKSRLRELHRFLVLTIAEAGAAPTSDRLEHLLATRTVSLGTLTMSMDEALRRLPNEPSSEGRATLERELDAVFSSEQALWARRFDAGLHATAGLAFPTPEALAEHLLGRTVAPRAARAEAALADSADAARDLLGFALRRLDPHLKIESARMHDLDRARGAPWLIEHFRSGDLLPAVARCLQDLGLSAGDRVTIDAEHTPGKRPGASAFELRVPEHIRLLLSPEPGLHTFSEWLRAWGVALHRSLVSAALPFVERSLGDAAIPQSFGLLFESFLLDEAWLKRYLRLTSAQAREVSRISAWRQLMALRREAGLLLVSRELLARGPGRPLAEHFAESMRRALLVAVPPGRFLSDTPRFAEGARQLDAWSLETTLHHHLRARFNEDYWRNPAAGRWLSECASKGQRDEAGTLSKALGQPDLELVPAVRRRVEAMGS